MEEQDPLESALKSLAPSAARIDPLAAAFEAGRSTAARRTRVWQGATALSLALCGAAWFGPMGQNNQTVPPGNPTVAVVARAELGPVSDESVLYLQEVVLRRGLDGLPRLDVPSARQVNVQELY
jgi:hypothetical protein